jgi:hypothetical protein
VCALKQDAFSFSFLQVLSGISPVVLGDPQGCPRHFSPKICIGVHQVMNTKVVDLAILYNFHKGHLVFFSTDFSQQACQL